jgi:hypothetical protein
MRHSLHSCVLFALASSGRLWFAELIGATYMRLPHDWKIRASDGDHDCITREEAGADVQSREAADMGKALSGIESFDGGDVPQWDEDDE